MTGWRVAAVDTGDEDAHRRRCLQVKDADAAEDGLAKLLRTATARGRRGRGWAIEGDWALLAETDDIAEDIADDGGRRLARR